MQGPAKMKMKKNTGQMIKKERNFQHFPRHVFTRTFVPVSLPLISFGLILSSVCLSAPEASARWQL